MKTSSNSYRACCNDSNSIRYNLTLCLFILTFGCPLNGQFLDWAVRIGATGDQDGESVAIDASGNIYVTGRFKGTVDFNPSPSSAWPLTAGGVADVYVTKMDSDGHMIWAKRIGGSAGQVPYGIAVDASGNVYVTGWSAGSCDYDPGVGVFTLSGGGEFNSFICKLSSDGDFVWAKVLNGGGQSLGWDIVVDSSGNVYSIGHFDGVLDFDPGSAEFNLDAGFLLDTYILKLDSDGNFQWVGHLDGLQYCLSYGICLGKNGQVYASGVFSSETDFDPGADEIVLTPKTDLNVYVLSLSPNGTFNWVKQFDLGDVDGFVADKEGFLYLTGAFGGKKDFDPDTTTYYLTSAGQLDVYVLKIDEAGKTMWARSFGGIDTETPEGIAIDKTGRICVSGKFIGEITTTSDLGTFHLDSKGTYNIFSAKWSNEGYFQWAVGMGGNGTDESYGCGIDSSGSIFVTGYFESSADFDPGPDSLILMSAGNRDIFMARYVDAGGSGSIFYDANGDCVRQPQEYGLADRRAVIQPGNLVVESNEFGYWLSPELSPGDYSITFDTMGNWVTSCPAPIDFVVDDLSSPVFISPFGIWNTEPCGNPTISVFASNLIRCFSDRKIFILACNQHDATGIIEDAFIELSLDPLIIPTSASVPFHLIGNNLYRFEIGNLFPGQCVNVELLVDVSCEAILGQTLCLEANLYPADSCVYDPPQWISSPGDPPCTFEWDRSSIFVEGWCSNDQIHFAITNTGESGIGDMQCFAPIRVYADGVYLLSDSIKLAGADMDTLTFAGDGRTWRIEVDDHPLHPGRPLPNVTVERCGNPDNWTSGLVSNLPENDMNSIVDIFCAEVSGSFDPNDKIGYPYGVDGDHLISPNGKIDFVIRFQNTGNDTAFTVVIRDTLDMDLDIFTVISGVSSHQYLFRMYGPRVLEWTFNNIQLPDSIVDLEGSNGFVTFSVFQNRDLPDGTEIANSAAIYFDFNEPVITNTTLHTVGRMFNSPSWTETKEVTLESCNDISYNNLVYTSPGTYWQVVDGGVNTDTLVTLNVRVPKNVDNSITLSDATLSSNISGETYQWLNCTENSPIVNETSQNFTATVTGNYALIITQNGCVDTSDCYAINLVGINDNAFASSLSAYPNPNDGTFTIDFGNVLPHAEITVFNTLGKEVYHSQSHHTSQVTLNLTQKSGVYFVQVHAANKVGLIRIVVHGRN